MKASMTTRLLLTIAFLAIIFSEGVVQMAIELSQGDHPQLLDLVTRKPTPQHLRSFETAMENNSWSTKATRPVTQYARYVLCNDLGAKGVPGLDNWLFYRPDVDYLVQPWPTEFPSGNPLPAVVDFRDQLAARGITLLVMIAPGKPGVYPGKLSSRVEGREAEVHAHTTEFIAALSKTGVPFVDLFSRYAKARKEHGDTYYYLAHDTHWSPEGVRLAATAVAERIRAEGWIQEGDRAYTEQFIEAPREGDLVHMIESPRIAQQFTPQPVACTQIINPTTGAPYQDDPTSQILVLGDSFLRIYEGDTPGSAGFIAHLARELKQPLASIVSDGGASTLVRQELSRKPELLHGKKLVLWEFVERDLRFGTEGWQHVPLGVE